MPRPVTCRYPKTYNRIVKFLLEGDANSNQIFQYLNDSLRNGCTMARLGNILSKMPEFHDVGTEMIYSPRGKYEVKVWRYVPWES